MAVAVFCRYFPLKQKSPHSVVLHAAYVGFPSEHIAPPGFADGRTHLPVFSQKNTNTRRERLLLFFLKRQQPFKAFTSAVGSVGRGLQRSYTDRFRAMYGQIPGKRREIPGDIRTDSG
jgi:hypothetical protein